MLEANQTLCRVYFLTPDLPNSGPHQFKRLDTLIPNRLGQARHLFFPDCQLSFVSSLHGQGLSSSPTLEQNFHEHPRLTNTTLVGSLSSQPPAAPHRQASNTGTEHL